MKPVAKIGRCPRCGGAGSGPFVHRGRLVMAVCDACRVRWNTTLTPRDVAMLDVARLAYEGVEPG